MRGSGDREASASARSPTPVKTLASVLLVAGVVLLDALVAWGLYGLGVGGLRDIGGWGMLMVGMVLTATAAANLLVLFVFVYRAAVRRAQTISEQSP